MLKVPIIGLHLLLIAQQYVLHSDALKDFDIFNML